MSQKQATLMQWLKPVEAVTPQPVEEVVVPEKRPCSKRLRKRCYSKILTPHPLADSSNVPDAECHLYVQLPRAAPRGNAAGLGETHTSFRPLRAGAHEPLFVL